MGGGSSHCDECAGMEDDLRASAQAIAEEQQKVAIAQARMQTIEEEMRRRLDELKGAQKDQIDGLKEQIDKSRLEKDEIAAHLRVLQKSVAKMSIEHGLRMNEAQKTFQQMMANKDQALQVMMKDMMATFKTIITNFTEKNERQFKMMLDLMDRQKLRVEKLFERAQDQFDRMLDNDEARENRLEKQRLAKEKRDKERRERRNKTKPTNAPVFIGAKLYQMVEEQKLELANRGSIVPKFEIHSTAPLYTAAFAALGAALGATVPAISH